MYVYISDLIRVSITLWSPKHCTSSATNHRSPFLVGTGASVVAFLVIVLCWLVHILLLDTLLSWLVHFFLLDQKPINTAI